MPGMRRREFVTLLGGAAAAWPIEARAQQLSSILIGFLSASSAAAFTKEIDAFRDGLRKLGYIEGRNVRLEYRFASGDLDELAVLGAELVQLKPNIIVSFALPATLALAKATSTIPIVMASGADPVGFGLVKSLSHPGGNITGLTNFAEELASKQIDVMRELAPMGIDAAQAAKEATSSIPIVFVFGVRPDQVRLCTQSQSAGRKYHWHEPLHVGTACKTGRCVERTNPRRDTYRDDHQSKNAGHRAAGKRCRGGGRGKGAPIDRGESQQRNGIGQGVRLDVREPCGGRSRC